MIFEKSIGRDWCLVNAELHQESFTKEFERQLGWRFTEVIYEGKDKIVWVYYPPEEYMGAMRSFVVSKLDADLEWLKTQASIICRKVETAVIKLQQWSHQSFDNLERLDLYWMFEEFIQDNYEIWPRFLVMVMFPIQMEGYPTADKYQSAIGTAIEVRKRIESVGPLLDEIGTKFAETVLQKQSVRPTDPLARYVSYREIREYLQKGKLLDYSALLCRQQSFLVTNEGISGESLESYLTKNNHLLKTTEVHESATIITGKSAYPGRAKGRVRVVLSRDAFEAFKDGEVLVTSMTTPDYLPLMKKAAAFITDEGGVTCHAAIVAREMKKPCIIGTKIATHVLRTGMEVEVDADQGVITVLEGI